MAHTLGKRKRRENVSAVPLQYPASEDEDELRARFQQAFEKKFKPLTVQPKGLVAAAEDGDGDEEILDVVDSDLDWSGFSNAEEEIEVVKHVTSQDINQEELRQEMKSFMMSKPPSSDSKPRSTRKGEPTNEYEKETVNLKNDLALQRLLKESHLLDPDAAQSKPSVLEGQRKLKALDLRLQSLGAKKSLLQQEKMPLAHRKGIAAKASKRELLRRKEAAENGIVLEKAKVAVKATVPEKRQRDLGGPIVGKFREGVLKLSSKDVRSIQGAKEGSFGGRGARKKRR